MEKRSVVLESAVPGDENGLFVSAFSSEMEGSDNCPDRSMADLKSLLSAAKISRLEQFLLDNPRSYV